MRTGQISQRASSALTKTERAEFKQRLRMRIELKLSKLIFICFKLKSKRIELKLKGGWNLTRSKLRARKLRAEGAERIEATERVS